MTKPSFLIEPIEESLNLFVVAAFYKVSNSEHVTSPGNQIHRYKIYSLRKNKGNIKYERPFLRMTETSMTRKSKELFVLVH